MNRSVIRAALENAKARRDESQFDDRSYWDGHVKALEALLQPNPVKPSLADRLSDWRVGDLGPEKVWGEPGAWDRRIAASTWSHDHCCCGECIFWQTFSPGGGLIKHGIAKGIEAAKAEAEVALDAHIRGRS